MPKIAIKKGNYSGHDFTFPIISSLALTIYKLNYCTLYVMSEKRVKTLFFKG